MRDSQIRVSTKSMHWHFPRLWKRHNRWTVLIAACWMEALTGLSYDFSTYSGSLKTELGYDQRHINKLSVAKDLGDHIGIIAGLLCRVVPGWVIALIGTTLILCGYGVLWLLTSHTIPAVSFWLVCIIIYIGTNGATFIDTAALIACLSNFPSNQATAVGLLKGFTGICGAIFNQLYASFLAPDTTSFILLIAIGPTVVVGPFILMMGSGTDFNPEGSENDDLKFQLLCGAALLVGAYMLCVTLVQDFLTVSKAINIILTVVLFGMLLLPLAVPRTANWLYKRGEKEANTDLEEPLLVDNISADEGEDEKYDGDEDYNHDIDNDDESEYGGATSEASDDFANEVQVNGQSNAALFDGPKVSRGPNNVSAATGSSEITLSKAFRSLNYWLLFFSILFSMGSGITAFNNLGQVAEAQGYTSAQVFVSMVNIWNFVGRLGGGYISEILTRDYGYPRTMLLAIAQVCMALGHVLFATALPGSLYVAILFVAVGYGSLWSVFPTALSELFGLMNFGVLYNFGTMASPCGSLVYSTFIAGPVYDWHAKIQASSTCEGRVCFELTFFVLAGACLVASALSTILSIRTRKLELPQNDYRSHGHSYLIRNTSLFSV